MKPLSLWSMERTEPDMQGDSDISDVEVSRASERNAVLAAVLREQTERAEVEDRARELRAKRQRPGPRHVALVFATALSAWIWFWPPSMLRLQAPPPPTLENEEAALRLVMYFQAQKIEQFRIDTGRVPTDLSDAGPVFKGMEYVRLTDSDYRILGRTSRVILSYSSVEPLGEFVGESTDLLDLTVLE